MTPAPPPECSVQGNYKVLRQEENELWPLVCHPSDACNLLSIVYGVTSYHLLCVVYHPSPKLRHIV